MRRLTRNIALLALAAALIVGAGCANVQGPSQTAYKTGAVGAGVGAVAGALIDSKNSWRGGVIGAGLGALLGGAMGEISHQAAQEAAYRQQPVVYTNQAGTQRVVAQPIGSRGDCRIVKEKYYEHGQLVRETEREVCN